MKFLSILKKLIFRKKNKTKPQRSFADKTFSLNSKVLFKRSHPRRKKTLREKVSHLLRKPQRLSVVSSRPSGVKVFIRRYYSTGKNIFSFILIVGICYFSYSFLFKSDYFSVDFVSIDGASTYVNYEDIFEISKNMIMGKNLVSLNQSQVKSTLEKTFLGAKEIHLRKEFPNKVYITVVERRPIAILSRPDKEKFLIDTEGYVLGLVANDYAGLTEINYSGEVKIGEFVDPGIVPVSTELINSARNLEVKLSSMSFTSKYITAYVANGTEVLISNDKSKTEALQIVKELLKEISLEGKQATKIDLRYDKVIVLYD